MTSSTDEARRVVRQRHELRARLATVVAVERLTPRMARVTLGGDELEGFDAPGPTDHVKLCFPREDETIPAMPAIDERGRPAPPADGRRVIRRDFTPRAFDPVKRELVVDFAVHGAGVASAWVERARPGDKLGVLGPRGSKLVPHAFDWYLLGGDETAIPAVSRWLETLPAGARAMVFLEVAGPEEELALATRADATITWLHRGGASPGTTTLLADAVRALDLPPGDPFAFFAGEAGSVRGVRTYLRDEAGLHPDWVDVDGYWKRGTADFDHHAPEAQS